MTLGEVVFTKEFALTAIGGFIIGWIGHESSGPMWFVLTCSGVWGYYMGRVIRNKLNRRQP